MKLRTLSEITQKFENAEETGKRIKTNDIKKGDVFLQTNGWYGEMVDNMRGNIRVANIHGIYTEMGSIYVWDISLVVKDGKRYDIELTDKQKKDKGRVDTMFGRR